jgi:hypothetical protein
LAAIAKNMILKHFSDLNVNEDCGKTVCPKNMKKIPTDSPFRALQTPFTSCIPKVSPFGRNWEK